MYTRWNISYINSLPY